MVDRLAILRAAQLPGVSISELCRQAGVSRKTFYAWRARYAKEGAVGLEARSRRPLASPAQIPLRMEMLICRLREELPCDNGAQHIGDELVRRGVPDVPSVRTIHRVLVRNGLVELQPRKRPRSSFIRFEYDRPNACWQIDATQWKLRNGRVVWILDLIDDHSRKVVAALAAGSDTAANAWAAFCRAAQANGVPAKVLSDNGASFSGAATRTGPGEFEIKLAALGVIKANSRPYHPQTCGKLERFHQTLKKWLRRQPRARSLPELQRQLDTFLEYYNHERPHRALGGATPAQRFAATPPAYPTDEPITLPEPTTNKLTIATRTANQNGTVYLGRATINLGRPYAHHSVTLLRYGTRIVITHDGTLIRRLTLEPGRRSYGILSPMS